MTGSASFAQAGAILSQFLYALLRAAELEGSWLCATPDLTMKAGLAGDLGIYGELMRLLARRLDELHPEGQQPVAGPRLRQLLDGAAAASGPGQGLPALVGLQTAIVAAAQARSAAAGLLDAPSALTLDTVARLLGQRAAAWDELGVETRALPGGLPEVGALEAYRGDEPIPPLPATPGRPGTWVCDGRWILRHRSDDHLASDRDCLIRFLHFVAIDVEYCAAEISARNFAEYRQMPLAFKLDMARQCWDEMRHALVLEEMLEREGGRLGDFTHCNYVWDKYLLGRSLAERLAIEQVFQEGNAVEANFEFIPTLARQGREDLVPVFEHINADEMNHVRSGNRWLLQLCDGDVDRYCATVGRAAELLGLPLASLVRVDRGVRRQAGFPEALIDRLEQGWRQKSA